MGEAGSRLAEGSIPRAQLLSLEQFHTQALNHLSSVLQALAEESAARSNDLLDTGEALHQTGRTLAERLFPSAGSTASLPPSTAFALGRILESIDRTVAYAQDVAQVPLDRALPFSRLPVQLREPEAPRVGSRAQVIHNTVGGTHTK
jgi:hypothetical protein